MSSSSQSGPSQQPNSPQPRRLQTPEERFGVHTLYAVEAEPEAETAPDPFVPLPKEDANHASPGRSAKGRRAKTRHERHRFEREAHRGPSRHTVQSRIKTNTHQEKPEPIEEEIPSPVEKPVVSPTLERIRDNRRRFWRRFAGVTTLLLIAAAGAAALFAPQMKIENVQITGLHATSPILVTPIAERLIGQNVFRANKGAIAQSVERLPTVASARVVLSTDVPPKVELQVIERKPIMRLGDGSSWWVADENGNPYRTANARDARLPALNWNGPIQTLKPLDTKKWEDAMELVSAVEGHRGDSKTGTGLGQIHAMELDANGDATLKLASPDGKGDLTLKLGNDQWNEKLARARMAMMYFARTKRQAAELNLIALNLPRWTPRGAENSQATPVPTEMSAPAT